MAQFQLFYFGIYGRAEPIRQLLSHAKVQFEDVRIQQQEWPTYKPQMPAGQVPVLQLQNGQKMNQSLAIMRYLGKQYGYYPEDALAAFEVDRLVDSYMDIYVSLFKPIMAPPEAKEELINTALKQLQQFLDQIEPVCGKGSWLVGSKITIADFWIGGLYTNAFNNPMIYEKQRWDEILAKYPNFKAYGQRYAEANGSYLATRPPAPL